MRRLFLQKDIRLSSLLELSAKEDGDYGRIKAQLADRDDYTSIIGVITDHLE